MGTPKWMVYMENPTKMDDLGVPPFKETSFYLPDIKPPFTDLHFSRGGSLAYFSSSQRPVTKLVE